MGWGYVGPAGEAMLAQLGAMLAHLGAMLAHLGAMLAHLEAYVGPACGLCGPMLTHLRPLAPGKAAKMRRAQNTVKRRGFWPYRLSYGRGLCWRVWGWWVEDGQWCVVLLGLGLVGWGWCVGVDPVVACAFGFGVGGLVGRGSGWRVLKMVSGGLCFWVWGWWVGVGWSWFVLHGLGLVGWGWSVVVYAFGFGVGGLGLVGRGVCWQV